MRAFWLLLPTLALTAATARAQGPSLGRWHAWLDSPGGALPFELVLERTEDGELRAAIWNGPERIEIPTVAWQDDELYLGFEHYDSRIRAQLGSDGNLSGEWEKRRGAERWGRLPFHATPGASPRFPELATPSPTETLTGRWKVQFEEDELPAVAQLTQAGSIVNGTFMTATGDYRYLSGCAANGTLRLSAFDGAHAFLFQAELQEDGTLNGDFYSLDSWHERWTAARDDAVEPPDAFAQTTWRPSASLADLVLQDLDGELVSLAAFATPRRAIVLQLFGSWCPNCHDEAVFLVELDELYRDKGLAIMGLAFELTGDFERDAEQVRKFAARYGIEYPLYLVGEADKGLASQAFPVIDHLRSYPTTIFMTGDGQVRDIHSGFAGPATDENYAELRADFVARIDALLAEEPEDDAATWEALAAPTKWAKRGIEKYHTLVFHEDDDGGRIGVREERNQNRKRINKRRGEVRLSGDAVWIGERLYRYDQRAGVLVDPRRFEVRYYLNGDLSPVITEFYGSDEESIIRATEDDDPVIRREALLALAYDRSMIGAGMNEFRHFADDPDYEVRLALVTAVAMTKDRIFREVNLRLFDHPYPPLRRQAILALARWVDRDPEIRDRIKQLKRDDPNPLVRQAAKATL